MNECIVEWITEFNDDGSMTLTYAYNPIKQSIVRCKDCKFSEEMCDGRISCLGYLTEPWDYHNDQPNYTWVRPDGFCAWGVRKADA